MQVFLEMTRASGACNLAFMEIGKRIEKLLLVKNDGNMSELARFCDVSPQAVQQWIEGKTAPRGKRLRRIAEFFAITEVELAYGDLETISQYISGKCVKNAESNVIELHTPPVERRALAGGRRAADSMEDEIKIPQFDAGGSMGNGRVLLADQPGLIRSWHVNPDWLRLNVRDYTSVDNLCIVTGFGPSMRPLFNPGDPLLVDRGIVSVEVDSIYFFRLGNHGFIKILQRIPHGNKIVLRAKSKNPDYESFDIDESSDFEVFGRVLTIWKSEQF